MMDALQKLTQEGVSVWLDDLSRQRIHSGSLAALVKSHCVRGVTTNPTIFAAALASDESYAESLKKAKQAGLSALQTIFEITTADVSAACDIFATVFKETNGYDGRVSIEVDPELAFDTDSTIKEAERLWQKVARPNVMIKIPATKQGLKAIQETIGAGISVNVTLIFSIERYREVIESYFEGLRIAASRGISLNQIHSVASFFVSRVDTELDPKLRELGGQAASLAGRVAIANARDAYGLFLQKFRSEEWKKLAEQGANLQRPLMASTGVKDPAFPDTMYVTELVARHVVNTMPEKTLLAVADHGVIQGDTITKAIPSARDLLEELASFGVDLASVTEKLESEGVSKFIDSWRALVMTVEKALVA